MESRELTYRLERVMVLKTDDRDYEAFDVLCEAVTEINSDFEDRLQRLEDGLRRAVAYTTPM